MLTLVNQKTEFLVEQGSEVLVISRTTGDVRSVSSQSSEASRAPHAAVKPIVGVLGIIEVPGAQVLAVVTNSKSCGSIDGGPVYKVTQTELFPLNPASRDIADYLSLLKSHLDRATLFYSPRYDLSSHAQRSAQLQAKNQPTLNPQFVWNWEASQKLLKIPTFFFPVIFGVFSTGNVNVNGHNVEFGVISRRSRFRAGTRYFRRGLDSDGHAANFNETEQIVRIGSKLFSYLQTRGSVPALWSEINNLRYKPQLRVGDLAESVSAAKKHFRDQEQQYGQQYLVNLVNQSGYEQPIKEVYEAVVNQLHDPLLHYIYFDFHHECSKMRWHRVQLLIDELRQQNLDDTMYFEADAGKVVHTQSGVVRTNCMDCLDRTNVVQSTIALYQLERQLQAAQVLPEGARIAKNEAFVSLFRNIWADNADGVSCAYSGTGALKTDFTRTGKRTRGGALQDLRNSIVRYFRNNLGDGPRQDGFSLFLNDYPKPVRDLPFADRRPVLVQGMPYIAGGCALITALSILYPSETHSTPFNAMVTLVFALVAYFAGNNVVKNGLEYVNWPKLSPVRFVKWGSRGYTIAGEHLGSKEE